MPKSHESDAVFAEIGRITVRWAELEDALGLLVVTLLNDYQRYTRIVATELGYRSMIDLCTSLYLERHGEDEDYGTLKELIRRIEQAAGTRNSIVHSTWQSAGTPSKVTRVKSTAKRRGYSTTVQNYDTDSFRRISDSIVGVTNDLVAFASSLIVRGKGFNNPVHENG
ncbi:MAG: hypothetical protein AAB294_04725 [Pseudomonadota bacterium]